MNLTFSLLALGLLAAFLGILVWHVPRADLAAVAGVTFILVLIDLARHPSG